MKSFIDPQAEGTIIQALTDKDHLIPSFIFKMNQLLLSITPKDFSFIVEENLSDIFNRLANINAKINLMQNSALSFSIALDQDKIDLEKLVQLFQDSFDITYQEELQHALATKVRINKKKKRGSIVIEFYSSEDLQRITTKIRQAFSS